jgi:hypothetical protein
MGTAGKFKWQRLEERATDVAPYNHDRVANCARWTPPGLTVSQSYKAHLDEGK